MNTPTGTSTAFDWMDWYWLEIALGFLDPVFSSGVFLALKSGAMLADEVDAGSVTPAQSPLTVFRWAMEKMQASIQTRWHKIVYAFYDPQVSFGDLVKQGECICVVP